MIFVGVVLLKDLVDIVKNVEFLFLIEIIYRKCERKKIGGVLINVSNSLYYSINVSIVLF